MKDTHFSLISATRPLPQNWSSAYTLVVRRTPGLLDKEWHVGDNGQGFDMMARFGYGPEGSYLIVITPTESHKGGLTQRHDHLTITRRFTPALERDNMRVRFRRESRPTKGPHPEGMERVIPRVLSIAVEQQRQQQNQPIPQ